MRRLGHSNGSQELESNSVSFSSRAKKYHSFNVFVLQFLKVQAPETSQNDSMPEGIFSGEFGPWQSSTSLGRGRRWKPVLILQWAPEIFLQKDVVAAKETENDAVSLMLPFRSNKMPPFLQNVWQRQQLVFL